MAQKVKLLFIAADIWSGKSKPTHPKLSLGSELDGIRKLTENFREAYETEFISLHDVTLETLADEVSNYAPHILHFAGHGISQGLLIQGF